MNLFKITFKPIDTLLDEGWRLSSITGDLSRNGFLLQSKYFNISDQFHIGEVEGATVIIYEGEFIGMYPMKMVQTLSAITDLDVIIYELKREINDEAC